MVWLLLVWLTVLNCNYFIQYFETASCYKARGRFVFSKRYSIRVIYIRIAVFYFFDNILIYSYNSSVFIKENYNFM
jgi:hypothetical protein